MTLIRLRTETSTGAICCRTMLLALALAGLLLVGTGGQAQTFTVLHKFHNGRDGAFPYDALLLDASGNLYGTTAGGGSFAYGTVFENYLQREGDRPAQFLGWRWIAAMG